MIIKKIKCTHKKNQCQTDCLLFATDDKEINLMKIRDKANNLHWEIVEDKVEKNRLRPDYGKP